MISSFYDYGGLAALISMIGWVGAWVCLVVYIAAKKLRHANIGRAAVALALVAYFAGRLASATIGDIQTLQTPPPEDPERAKTLEGMQNRAANVRFAEDSATDKLDIGGASSREMQVAGVATTQAAAAGYDWRSRGKQTRDSGMSKSLNPTEATETQPAESGEAPAVPARMLPEAEVFRANKLDDINLFFTRTTLVIAVLFLLIDYLLRFNQTFTRVLPLPIAGRIIDSFFPKSYLVYVSKKAGESGPGTIKSFLEKALLKHENFIYLGAEDPWASDVTLPRLIVGKKKIRIDKLICDAQITEQFRAFAFEAVWHGQGCVVCVGEEASNAMLDFAASVLCNRTLNLEPARRTVNIVWDFETPPPDVFLERLAGVCPTSNFRLFVVASAPPAKGKMFQEVYSSAQIAL